MRVAACRMLQPCIEQLELLLHKVRHRLQVLGQTLVKVIKNGNWRNRILWLWLSHIIHNIMIMIMIMIINDY